MFFELFLISSFIIVAVYLLNVKVSREVEAANRIYFAIQEIISGEYPVNENVLRFYLDIVDGPDSINRHCVADILGNLRSNGYEFSEDLDKDLIARHLYHIFMTE